MSAKHSPRRAGNLAVAIVLLLGFVLLLSTGCSTPVAGAQWEVIPGPGYEPHNFSRLAPKLDPRIRRVAILPLTTEPGDSDTLAGRDAMEPILQAELDRRGLFEVVRVTQEQMRRWTGRAHWQASDKLPLNFLKTLKEEPGCDAVLFARLTRYNAYPPLAIGWNLKLVDTTDGQIWWAADEVFDTANPKVVNSARRHQLAYQKHNVASPLLADSKTVLMSPRRLGHYTVDALLSTLPDR